MPAGSEGTEPEAERGRVDNLRGKFENLSTSRSTPSPSSQSNRMSDEQIKELERDILELRHEEKRLIEIRREKERLLARLSGLDDGNGGSNENVSIPGLQDSDSVEARRPARGSENFQQREIHHTIGDFDQDKGRLLFDRDYHSVFDASPRANRPNALKSHFSNSPNEFKVKIECGKEHRLLQFNVRVTYNMFLQTVLDAFFMNLTEEDITRMMHHVDSEGDVIKVNNDEVFEDIKEKYLQSGHWSELKPLRIVFLQDDIDPLSLVAIPPHEGCDEPITWKQGKLLGQGAYGSVHMGMKGDGTLLAVKRLDLSSDKGRHVFDTYNMEKSLLEKLKHPNIVRYIASKVVSKSLAVIWMEYVPGGSVANILQAFGAMSEDILRHYTRQILKGLHYLHGNSVIHRDIKPGNILVTVSGVVKLSDFGSSLRVTSTLQKGSGGMKAVQPVGTPNYIAPEVVRAKNERDYTYNIDIWSLGITAIEMITAELPFQEYTNHMALIWNIGRLSKDKPNAPKPPIPPRSMSEEGRDFILKCLEPDPAIRLHSAELLKHEFVRGEDVQEQASAVGFEKSMKLKRSANVLRAMDSSKTVTSHSSSEVEEADVFEDAQESDDSASHLVGSRVPAAVVREDSAASLIRSLPRGEELSFNSEFGEFFSKSMHFGGSKGSDSSFQHEVASVVTEEELLNGVCLESAMLSAAPDASSFVQVDDDALAKLVNMGWTVETSSRALSMFDNNVELAANWLLSNPEDSESKVNKETQAAQRLHAQQTSKGPAPAANVGPVGVRASPPVKPGLAPAAAGAKESASPAAAGRDMAPAPAAGERDVSVRGQILPLASVKEGAGGLPDHLAGPRAEMPAASKPVSPPQWRFLHHRHWRLYDPEDARQLEKAYQDGKDSFIIEIKTDSHYGNQYEMRLKPRENMSQRNIDSGFKRPIMRGTAEEFESLGRKESSLKHSIPANLVTVTVPTRQPEVADYLRQKVEIEKQEKETLRRQFEEQGSKVKVSWSWCTAPSSDRTDPASFVTNEDASVPKSSDRSPVSNPLSPSDRPKEAMANPFHRTLLEDLPPSFTRNLSLSRLASRLAPRLRPSAHIEGKTDVNVILRLHVGNMYNGKGSPPVESIMRSPAASPDAGSHESFASSSVKEKPQAHSWTAFVREANGSSLSRYIKRVSFDLFPDKRGQAKIDINAEPYEVTRWSLVPFEILIHIILHDDSEYTVSHWLCLSKSGSWSDQKASTEDDAFPVTSYALFQLREGEGVELPPSGKQVSGLSC